MAVVQYFSLLPLVFLLIISDITSISGEFPELSEEVQELLDWSPPYQIKKKFPYFLSGYDAEGSPVWICEAGRFPFREVLETGDNETIANLDKYLKQLARRIYESPRNATRITEDGEEEPVEDVVLIEDADGFDARQFSHPATLVRVLSLFREASNLERLYGKRIKTIYSINNNFFGVQVWRLSQPVLGDIVNRIQFFGTNQEKWKPVLHRDVPAAILPPWLGGYENFTALQIYG